MSKNNTLEQEELTHLQQDLEWAFIEISILKKLLRATFVRPEIRRLSLILKILCEEMEANGGFLGVGLNGGERYREVAFEGDLKGEAEKKIRTWMEKHATSLPRNPCPVPFSELGIQGEGNALTARVYIPDTGRLLGVLSLTRRSGEWPSYQARALPELVGMLVWFFASASLPEYAQEVLDEFRTTGRLW